MLLQTVRLGSSPRAGGSIFYSGPFMGAGAPVPVQRPGLGQVEQQWYARAKAAVLKYDDLVVRARRIASPPVRERILAQYGGDPRDPESALYRRNSVAYNVAEAESYTPVNYLIYQTSRLQNRVEKLEDWNRGFKEEVEEAERTYGLLPEPVVVERVVQTVGPAQAPAADYTLPIVLGAAALAGLAFLVFGD